MFTYKQVLIESAPVASKGKGRWLTESKTKKVGLRGIAMRALAIVLVLMAVVAVAVGVLFGHEIKTVASIKKLDSYPLYEMTYDGDYGIDEFLAQGGASNDGELIDFVIHRLMKGLPVKIELPDLACATFNATTPEGDALFGRNFDLEYSPGMLVHTAPKDGYASISMVNLGFLGYGKDKLPEDLMSSVTALAAPYAPLDGVNEKGLAVGVLLIDTKPTDQRTDKVDITTTTAIRMMLDTCATVDEAVKLLEKYDMHSSAKSCYHFQIADAGGKSVVVEYLGNTMHVLNPGDATTAGPAAPEKTYMAATNFLLTPGTYDFGAGQDRHEKLMEQLDASQGTVSEKQAMDMLKSVSREIRINDDGGEFQTQWSVVYNLQKATASVVMGEQYDKPAHEFAVRR